MNEMSEYKSMLEKLTGNIKDIKLQVQYNFNQYIKSMGDQKKLKLALVPTLAISGIGFGIRTVTLKLFAAFTFGGGVLGVAFTAYTLYDVHMKIKQIKEQSKKLEESSKINLDNITT